MIQSKGSFIPYDKLSRIIKRLEGLIACWRVPVREVSKAVGLVISCMLAVGPTLLLLCRGIYQRISEAESFDVIKSLDEIRGDLSYIKDVMPSIHRYLFEVKELVQSFSVVFASGASGVAGAVGASCVPRTGTTRITRETAGLRSSSKSSRRKRPS